MLLPQSHVCPEGLWDFLQIGGNCNKRCWSGSPFDSMSEVWGPVSHWHFPHSQFSGQNERTFECEMTGGVAVCLSISRTSAITRSRTLAVVSWYMAVSSLPGRRPFWILFLPLLHSADHVLTVAQDAASFPEVLPLSSSMALGLTPFFPLQIPKARTALNFPYFYGKVSHGRQTWIFARNLHKKNI